MVTKVDLDAIGSLTPFKPTDPLTRISSWQDYTNKVLEGNNIEQGIKRTEEERTRSRANFMSPKFGALLSKKTPITESDVHNLIMEGHSAKFLTDDDIVAAKAEVPKGATDAEYRDYLTKKLIGGLAASDAANRVLSSRHLQETGQGTQPHSIQGPQAGINPNVATPTGPLMPGGYPSRKELADQTSRPATQADVDAAAKVGVQLQINQQITQTLMDRLIEQGRPGLVGPAGAGSGGAGTSGGGSPPVPTTSTGGGGVGGGGGVPSRTVPPVDATGKPIGNANPAGLKGGYVVTGAPPNAATETKEDADAYHTELASSRNFTQENQQYTSAYKALQSTTTGRGGEPINNWQGFLLTVAPKIAEKLGVNASEVAYFDEAKKYLTALAMQTPGAARSEMQSPLAQMSNPSTAISNQAAQKMLSIAHAFRKAKQAIFLEDAKTNSGTGASQGFNRRMTEQLKKIDYHAFMSHEQFNATDFDKYYKDLSPEGKRNLGFSLQLARDHLPQ